MEEKSGEGGYARQLKKGWRGKLKKGQRVRRKEKTNAKGEDGWWEQGL